MKVLGVDVGGKGALALICTATATLALLDMPTEIATGGKSVTSPLGVAQAIQAAAPDAIFIEHVTASPQMGVTSSFQFGRAYGIVLGAAAGVEATLWPVRPAEWKRRLQVPADKRQSVTRATQLLPAAHAEFRGPRGGVVDGRAEAAMVALYGVMTAAALPRAPLKLTPFPASSLFASEA